MAIPALFAYQAHLKYAKNTTIGRNPEQTYATGRIQEEVGQGGDLRYVDYLGPTKREIESYIRWKRTCPDYPTHEFVRNMPDVHTFPNGQEFSQWFYRVPRQTKSG